MLETTQNYGYFIVGGLVTSGQLLNVFWTRLRVIFKQVQFNHLNKLFGEHEYDGLSKIENEKLGI
jgi:predicted DNA-binding ribbon-helix-helix protein